jgi:REP element-mobilizing transposase RayT
MTIPYRGTTTTSTYFITAGIYLKKPVLQSDGMADLFCETLFRYREHRSFDFTHFVVMPIHFHMILSVPEGSTLERAVQLIRGGFYQAGKLRGKL